MTDGQALALSGGAAAAQPVVWNFLGYQFEAGSMIAALIACLMVRAYRGTRGPQYSARLDMPVSILTLLVTVGCVIHFRPEPLFGIVYGMGLGAMGELLIVLAEKWVRKLEVFSGGPDHIPPYSSEETERLTRKFDGESNDDTGR